MKASKQERVSEDAATHANSASEDRSGSLPPASATSWLGWAELENDPLIFSTLLREWGVPNVQVNEVIPIDAIFDTPSESLLGLIFLSRWVKPESESETTTFPSHIWFANQISAFSCATVAIMNIINNRADIDLGPQLKAFYQSTWDMSSKDRGLALDQLNYVRDVHNSFSTELERMDVDSGIKEDVKKSRRHKKPKRSRKSSATRKKSTNTADEENGFHFVAYVPVGGQTWKMDGLERRPRLLGTCEHSNDWLTMAIADIQSQFEHATANELEFSLVSLTRRGDTQIPQEEVVRVQRMKEDWGPFIAQLVKMHAEKGNLGELLT